MQSAEKLIRRNFPNKKFSEDYFTLCYGPNKLTTAKRTKVHQPILKVQGFYCVPIPFRERCIPESIVLGKYIPHSTNLAWISYELAELKEAFCKDYNGITYFWKNRRICNRLYADNEKDNENYKNYCMIIDLSNVAIANQYKNQFDQALNKEHVAGNDSNLPKNFRNFDMLEKALKNKFKEYCMKMKDIKDHDQIWYKGGVEKNGEYAPEERETKEDKNFLYQCYKCTKIRSVPYSEISKETRQTLKIGLDKGILTSQVARKMDCNELAIVKTDKNGTTERTDNCDKVMDDFLSASIGHGCLCRDSNNFESNCKLCAVDRKLMLKKDKPGYFLYDNTIEFDDCFEEVKQIKKRILEERKRKEEEERQNRLRQTQIDIEEQMHPTAQQRKERRKQKSKKRRAQRIEPTVDLDEEEIHSPPKKRSNRTENTNRDNQTPPPENRNGIATPIPDSSIIILSDTDSEKENRVQNTSAVRVKKEETMIKNEAPEEDQPNRSIDTSNENINITIESHNQQNIQEQEIPSIQQNDNTNISRSPTIENTSKNSVLPCRQETNHSEQNFEKCPTSPVNSREASLPEQSSISRNSEQNNTDNSDITNEMQLAPENSSINPVKIQNESINSNDDNMQVPTPTQSQLDQTDFNNRDNNPDETNNSKFENAEPQYNKPDINRVDPKIWNIGEENSEKLDQEINGYFKSIQATFVGQTEGGKLKKTFCEMAGVEKYSDIPKEKRHDLALTMGNILEKIFNDFDFEKTSEESTNSE